MTQRRSLLATLSGLLHDWLVPADRQPFSLAELAEQARRLQEQLAQSTTAQRWQLPFPLAVYGTLREGKVNSHLMHRGRVAGHARAFLPHFVARGIELFHQPNATAPFEMFFYHPRQWKKVMGPVEQLENFVPGQVNETGYHRSLAWLGLLPDGFDHPAFRADLDQERNLELDPQTWSSFDRIPCWIYSSIAENRRAAAAGDSPIIWDGVVVC